jgi:hypothetical protein
MPDQWDYRDVEPPRPPHRPAQAVPPQAARSTAPRYSQTRHLTQLNGRAPQEPPASQPSFTPQAQQYPQQPGYPPQPPYQPAQPYGSGYGPAQPPQQPPKKRKGLSCLGCLGVFALIAIIGGVAAAHSGSSSSAGLTSQSPVAVATGEQPAAQQPAAPASSAPAMTVAEASAVQAAQQYLSLGSGFSEAGLLQQLTSSDGSGFSPADAQFAINYVQPDWDQQADLSAKNYMNTIGGFSASSLLQQLTSPDGGQFTQSQAQQAVQAVGL